MHTLVAMLAVLVLLAAIVVAQEGHEGHDTTPSTPKLCCRSNEYTTTASVIISKTVDEKRVGLTGTEYYVHDHMNKLLYIESSMTEDHTQVTTNVKILRDYNNKKQYVTKADGSCFVQPLVEAIRSPCIPDDATFIRELTLAEGPDALKTLAFRFAEGLGVSKAVVSADTCTPIVDVRAGRIEGEDQTRSDFYFNFQSSIANRSLLAVPANCDIPMPAMPTVPAMPAVPDMHNVPHVP